MTCNAAVQAGKDRLKARIGDAQLAASAAPEAAPAASAAVGSPLESGMASGVAAAPDAEHVDDAGTPPRPIKVRCFPERTGGDEVLAWPMQCETILSKCMALAPLYRVYMQYRMELSQDSCSKATYLIIYD